MKKLEDNQAKRYIPINHGTALGNSKNDISILQIPKTSYIHLQNQENAQHFIRLTEIRLRNIIFASCTPFFNRREMAWTAEFPDQDKMEIKLDNKKYKIKIVKHVPSEWGKPYLTYNKITENTQNFNKSVFINDAKIPGLSQIYVGVLKVFKFIQLNIWKTYRGWHLLIYIENHPVYRWSGIKPMIC